MLWNVGPWVWEKEGREPRSRQNSSALGRWTWEDYHTLSTWTRVGVWLCAFTSLAAFSLASPSVLMLRISFSSNRIHFLSTKVPSKLSCIYWAFDKRFFLFLVDTGCNPKNDINQSAVIYDHGEKVLGKQ